jgi:hypothetical protein
MTDPTTITAGRIDLVVREGDVRINDPGLPPGHALRVVLSKASTRTSSNRLTPRT